MGMDSCQLSLHSFLSPSISFKKANGADPNNDMGILVFQDYCYMKSKCRAGLRLTCWNIPTICSRKMEVVVSRCWLVCCEQKTEWIWVDWAERRSNLQLFLCRSTGEATWKWKGSVWTLILEDPSCKMFSSYAP